MQQTSYLAENRFKSILGLKVSNLSFYISDAFFKSASIAIALSKATTELD